MMQRQFVLKRLGRQTEESRNSGLCAILRPD